MFIHPYSPPDLPPLTFASDQNNSSRSVVFIQDEEAAWKELMQETMKKKLDVDEEEVPDPFRKLKNKEQSGFMKQLSDLAQQPVAPTPPPPEPTIEEAERPVDSSCHCFHFHLCS